jgi:hypothetical protein
MSSCRIARAEANARLKRRLLPIVCLIGAVTVLGSVFRQLDVGEVSSLLGRVGPQLPLVFVPQLISFASETIGWRMALGCIGVSVDPWPLLRVRVATEAVLQSLPGGALVCETLKPALLERLCAVPVPAGIAGAVARKWLRLISHALYAVLAFGLAGAAFGRALGNLVGVAGLSWTLLACAALLALGAGTMAAWCGRQGPAMKLLELVRRVRIGRFAALADRRAPAFASTDAHLSRYFASPWPKHLLPVALSLGAWLCEPLETWLILRLLGVDIGFGTAVALEFAVSLARQLAFFVPGGIGVQDVGYACLLRGLALPGSLELGAALAVAKRIREACWVALGWGLLVPSSGAERQPETAPDLVT